MIIELRKERPLLKRKEYKEEIWRGYETLVLLTDEKNVEAFTGFIKQIVLEALNDNIIILRFSEISEQILNGIKDLFQDHAELKIYPKSKKGMFYTPGTVVSKIDTSGELEKILEHWGRVDLLNLIALKRQMISSVLELLEMDVYELSAENLLLILNASTFAIRDSGDGNEAEIIYRIENRDYVESLLSKASIASGIKLSRVAND